jgi:hypothetical protein
MQRVRKDVPTADVIVTNPTHYAVALKYEPGMTAPKVVAKGADIMALKIREIAGEHGIPILNAHPRPSAVSHRRGRPRNPRRVLLRRRRDLGVRLGNQRKGKKLVDRRF